MEKARMRSNIARASVLVLGFALRELGLDEKRSVAGVALAGRQAGRDLGEIAAELPEGYRARLEPVVLDDEDRWVSVEGLQRVARHGDRGAHGVERGRGDEQSGPPAAVRIR